MSTNSHRFSDAASALAVTVLTTLAGGRVAAAADAANVQTGYAPVNGLRMYYEIHGRAEDTGVPLVLLHGGGSTIETSFAEILPSLSSSRQVIAFEQQGHGHTADIVDRPFSFEQSADDAAALLRHLDIESADFLGYSNGGNVALQIAVRHPERVRRLVAVSAMLRRDGLYPEFWESMKNAAPETMPDELRQAYHDVSPHPEQLEMFHEKCARRMLEFRDWREEDVRAIRAPTLVVVGDADIVRPEHAVEMFRLLPRGRLAVLPGTNHMTVVQRPDLLVSVVEAGLGTPGSRPSNGRQTQMD